VTGSARSQPLLASTAGRPPSHSQFPQDPCGLSAIVVWLFGPRVPRALWSRLQPGFTPRASSRSRTYSSGPPFPPGHGWPSLCQNGFRSFVAPWARLPARSGSLPWVPGLEICARLALDSHPILTRLAPIRSDPTRTRLAPEFHSTRTRPIVEACPNHACGTVSCSHIAPKSPCAHSQYGYECPRRSRGAAGGF
jgi:hypothetical protein